jgi:hypothetical protein
VRLHALDRLTEVAALQARPGWLIVGSRTAKGERAAERGDDLAGQGLALGVAAVVQDGDAARQVIEDEERARRQIAGVR